MFWNVERLLRIYYSYAYTDSKVDRICILFILVVEIKNNTSKSDFQRDQLVRPKSPLLFLSYFLSLGLSNSAARENEGPEMKVQK